MVDRTPAESEARLERIARAGYSAVNPTGDWAGLSLEAQADWICAALAMVLEAQAIAAEDAKAASKPKAPKAQKV